MENKYSRTIDWLFNQVPMFQNVGADAYKPGLEGVAALSHSFGNPHRKLRAIHVGGTNGKGSVSSLLASVLQESGLRTGLFTSPHLIDFRERIRINGAMIPEEEVVAFIDRYRALDLAVEPSFFELTTVMAFDWFARNAVDVAVVEVGLGGRLDSTNIITPLLSIITNISLDHTAQLGNTPAKIAAEKAGIIKKGVPVVIGRADGDVRKVFENKASLENAPIRFASDSPSFVEAENRFTHYIYNGTRWGEVTCPLSGDCQPENTATTLTALYILCDIFSLSADAVGRGFENVCRNTGLMGRWTILRSNPTVVCDTGHNPGGWDYLAPRLSDIASQGKLHIVAGFVNDKDIASIISKMPANADFYFATPSVKRGRDGADVLEAARLLGRDGRAFPTVAEAFMQAMRNASPADTVFVGGSTFVVADLLSALGKPD